MRIPAAPAVLAALSFGGWGLSGWGCAPSDRQGAGSGAPVGAGEDATQEGGTMKLSEETILKLRAHPLWSVAVLRVTEVKVEGQGTRSQMMVFDADVALSAHGAIPSPLRGQQYQGGRFLEKGKTYLAVLAGKGTDPVYWFVVDWAPAPAPGKERAETEALAREIENVLR